jgi:chromatin remodeling complex protein RSC6
MPTAAKKVNTTSESAKASTESAKVPASKAADSKSKVSESPAPVAAASASEPVKAEVAVVSEPAKKTRSKAAAPVVVAKVDEVGSSLTAALASDEPVSADDKTADVENVVQVLADKIGSLASLVKDIQSSLKPVLKEHDKLRKIVERIQKKRDNARKSPSGFAKPNKISDELCDFIGVPHGTEKSRTDITRYINAYVKEHNLNKPTNRRIILPDEKLKKILKINNEEEVTFFILQRLISHHFPAAGSKTVSSAPAPVPAVVSSA